MLWSDALKKQTDIKQICLLAGQFPPLSLGPVYPGVVNPSGKLQSVRAMVQGLRRYPSGASHPGRPDQVKNARKLDDHAQCSMELVQSRRTRLLQLALSTSGPLTTILYSHAQHHYQIARPAAMHGHASCSLSNCQLLPIVPNLNAQREPS